MRIKLLFLIFIWIGLLSCNSSPLKGVWIAAYSVNFKEDTASVSRIFDFYSPDSVSILSLSHFDANQPQRFHYSVNKDTVTIKGNPESVNYRFCIQDDNLHLFNLENETDTSSQKHYWEKEAVFIRPPKLSSKEKLTPDMVKGAFRVRSEELGTDTLEFINDSMYLLRTYFGYKDLRSWKLHQRHNLQFIEIWSEYKWNGYPAMLFPIQINGDSFIVSPNFNKDIKATFIPMKEVINKPDITGTWIEDSLLHILYPYDYFVDSTLFKTNLKFLITQDSIIREKRSSLSYISDYTGKELICITKKMGEDEEEYEEYFHYKIIEYSNENMVLNVVPRSGKIFSNFHYLHRCDTIKTIN